MLLCSKCARGHFCQRLATPILTDEELAREFFVADFRAFVAHYSESKHLKSSQWHDHLCELYRDYKGWIKNPDDSEIFLNMEVFEVEHIREWFRDFIQIVPPATQTRLRTEAKERVRIFATIMRARFPREAMMWGVRAANDNEDLS